MAGAAILQQQRLSLWGFIALQCKATNPHLSYKIRFYTFTYLVNVSTRSVFVFFCFNLEVRNKIVKCVQFWNFNVLYFYWVKYKVSVNVSVLRPVPTQSMFCCIPQIPLMQHFGDQWESCFSWETGIEKPPFIFRSLSPEEWGKYHTVKLWRILPRKWALTQFEAVIHHLRGSFASWDHWTLFQCKFICLNYKTQNNFLYHILKLQEV